MKLLSLLLAPTLAFCATFSGTVVSLDGTPVVGATIKAGTDSVTTTANGAWTLARASGIASRSGKTISVTSHLTVENGHPRLTFGGMDIRGRSRASVSLADAMRSSRDDKGPAIAAARSQGSRDTLRVYWKSKRLTVLTVPGDTGSITFRIDTAWKDDFGYARNPRIEYGSLLDARDGKTYRTVKMFGKEWMAENLDFGTLVPVASPNKRNDGTIEKFCEKDSLENCAADGGSYFWNEAMALPDSCNFVTTCSTATIHRGVCPAGWHLSSFKEWTDLRDSLPFNHYGTVKNLAGQALKSTHKSYEGDDAYGFGTRHSSYYDGTKFQSAYSSGIYSSSWTYWTSSRSDFYDNQAYTIKFYSAFPEMYADGIYNMSLLKTGMQVRCVKDSP
ncbi:MAG: hypothetical protein RL318_1323 [Fibrobacterota bacterium]|jgi:uncharacterized protein (TIGR02145 family)